MNFLNKAQVIGNITRDPDLKDTPNSKVITIGVATNRRWKNSNGEVREDVEYHNVVCWGKLAEIVAQYLKKGDKVFFEGRLQTRNWEDDAGNKHYRTEIVAQDMIMLGKKGGSSSNYSEKTDEPNNEETVEKIDEGEFSDIPS